MTEAQAGRDDVNLVQNNSSSSYQAALEIVGHGCSEEEHDLTGLPSMISLADFGSIRSSSTNKRSENGDNGGDNAVRQEMSVEPDDQSSSLEMLSKVHPNLVKPLMRLIMVGPNHVGADHHPPALPTSIPRKKEQSEFSQKDLETLLQNELHDPNKKSNYYNNAETTHRLCHYLFKRDDLYYHCKTCAKQDNAVICQPCFERSDHEGHHVTVFQMTTAGLGGCCDCGDLEAWGVNGCCDLHRPAPPPSDELPSEQQEEEQPSRDRPIDDKTTTAVSIEAAYGSDEAVMTSDENVESSSQTDDDFIDDDENGRRNHQLAETAIEEETASILEENDNEERSIPSSSSVLAGKHKTNENYNKKTSNAEYVENPGCFCCLAPFRNRQKVIASVLVADGPPRQKPTTQTSTALEPVVPLEAEVGGASMAGIIARNGKGVKEDEADIEDEDKEDDDDDDDVNKRLKGVVQACTDWLISQIGERDRQAKSQLEPHTAMLERRGREEGGLFLVMYSDEENTDLDAQKQALEELWWNEGDTENDRQSDHQQLSIEEAIALLQRRKQLVFWGTNGEYKPDTLSRGEVATASEIDYEVRSSLILKRASILEKKFGIRCSLFTRKDLCFQKHAIVLLQLLHTIASTGPPGGPAASLISDAMMNDHDNGTDDCLVKIMFLAWHSILSDGSHDTILVRAWSTLLHDLMAVQSFKHHVASVYVEVHPKIALDYAHAPAGFPTARSPLSLSDQFLNRPTFVTELIKKQNVMRVLSKSLLDTLQEAVGSRSESTPNGKESDDFDAFSIEKVVPEHRILLEPRYTAITNAILLALETPGAARHCCQTVGEGALFLDYFIQSLGLMQFVHMKERVEETTSDGVAIEVNSERLTGAFNFSINLGLCIERLLFWNDTDEAGETLLEEVKPTFQDIVYYSITKGIIPWQHAFQKYLKEEMGQTEGSLSLPVCQTSIRNGTDHRIESMLASLQVPWSFHMPLYRFASLSIRNLCSEGSSSMGGNETQVSAVIQRLQETLSPTDFTALVRAMIEFPAQLLARTSQIVADLWEESGGNLLFVELMYYIENPYGRLLRDADLLLLQTGLIAGVSKEGKNADVASVVGPSFLIHLLLHQHGLFTFLGLTSSTSEDEESGSIAEPLVLTDDEETLFSLWCDFFKLLILILAELPLDSDGEGVDTDLSPVKFRLTRELVHRLVTGPKSTDQLREVLDGLSYRDRIELNEEGKQLVKKRAAQSSESDVDETTAILHLVLEKIANHVTNNEVESDSSDKLWELRRSSWEDFYDPFFFHLNKGQEQNAAEKNRPDMASWTFRPMMGFQFGAESRPCLPTSSSRRGVHTTYKRLRRDMTADATLLAILYRALHIHFLPSESLERNRTSLRGKLAYDSMVESETLVSQALTLLTYGAYAWQEEVSDFSVSWRTFGGGADGSISYKKGSTYCP